MSVAVVLKHAYIFGEHEEAVGELARELGFTQVRLSSASSTTYRLGFAPALSVDRAWWRDSCMDSVQCIRPWLHHIHESALVGKGLRMVREGVPELGSDADGQDGAARLYRRRRRLPDAAHPQACGSHTHTHTHTVQRGM